MIAAPGSTLWLLRHEVRLNFRNFLARRGRGGIRGPAFLVVVLVLTLLVGGLPLAFALREVVIPVGRVGEVVADVVLAAVFVLMLSQTLYAATDALYDRADLDLLFSSPLEPRRVMTVRFLGVAATVTAVFAGFISPLFLPVALIGHPGWLGLYAVLAAAGLVASAMGLLLAVGLFRLIGPRRTRTVGQVLAALIGAAVFLASQARNILGAQRAGGLAHDVAQLARNPNLHLPPFADWPLRAMLGQPLPLALIFGGALGLFFIVTDRLGRAFALDAAAAAGAGAGEVRRASGPTRPFAKGVFAATLRKEFRLLARDPALIAQVLLRILFLVPLGALLLRQAGTHQDLLLPSTAAALSVVASQLAGSLAWIVISAEDSPDLLAASPAQLKVLNRAKLTASLAPVAVLLLPILAPVLVLSPLVGAVATLGCAVNAVATAFLNLWWQRPGKRTEFRARRSSSWFVTTAELALGLVIAAATGMLAAWMIWGLIPAALAGLGLLLLRRPPREGPQA